GLASATGFEIAKILNPEIVVTFDADGQHNAADVEKLINPILRDEADVVIGSRMLSKSGMPFKRRIYNRIANIVTLMFYGVWVSDTQSGLKAFNRKAYNLINIEQARMEFCSEIIYKIYKNNLRYKEVAIRPFYTKYSLSKGQSFIMGIKTFTRLLLGRLAGRR
ncbi:MAG: glycosyltransferase family 2 protein, partial [Candidatus Omnitrophica bacterium]|nr:glycosyltransferase family 2 protein [Candidatus Omnitrophota bacterium]